MISDYLDQIIFWVGSCIAALGGTGACLGILFKSISSLIKGLKNNVNGYDEQVEKLQQAGDKLTDVGGSIAMIGEKLADVTKQLEEQKAINDKLSSDYAKIQQILFIFAHNNSELANAGAIKYVDEILDIQKKEEITEV